MNPGPTEEAGKVAGGVVEALKSQPALLMILIFNFLIFGAIFWAVRDQRHYQHEIMTALIAQQAKDADLLSKCIVPHP